MYCPKCHTLIFDAYTDEERIRQLYRCHTVASWAKGQLKILAEMAADHKLPQWYVDEVNKIREKIYLVPKDDDPLKRQGINI